MSPHFEGHEKTEVGTKQIISLKLCCSFPIKHFYVRCGVAVRTGFLTTFVWSSCTRESKYQSVLKTDSVQPEFTIKSVLVYLFINNNEFAVLVLTVVGGFYHYSL